jgi:hypothetical protein
MEVMAKSRRAQKRASSTEQHESSGIPSSQNHPTGSSHDNDTQEMEMIGSQTSSQEQGNV